MNKSETNKYEIRLTTRKGKIHKLLTSINFQILHSMLSFQKKASRRQPVKKKMAVPGQRRSSKIQNAPVGRTHDPPSQVETMEAKKV